MSKPVSLKKRKAAFIAIAAVIIAAVIFALLFFEHLEKKADKVPEGAGTSASRVSEDTTLTYNGKNYVYNDHLSTLMILGIDDPELTASDYVRNQSQSDFILLAVFDSEKKTCQLIQLNRDSMTDIPVMDDRGQLIGTNFEQLALAHTYGNGLDQSCKNTEKAVSNLMYGIPIDHYFAVTMDAIPVLNDLVGGVTVKVEDDFTGVDDTLIKGETVTLTADNVEHFVRTRLTMKDDKSNIARMHRQQVYMQGLFEKMNEAYKKNDNFVLDTYDAIAPSLVSDCTIDQMSDYAECFSTYTHSEIVSPEGEAKKGETYMEFYVDDAALQQLVVDTFYLPAEG